MDPRYPKKLLASITTNKNAHAFVPCQPCTRLDVIGATTENWPHWSNSEEKQWNFFQLLYNFELGWTPGPDQKKKLFTILRKQVALLPKLDTNIVGTVGPPLMRIQLVRFSAIGWFQFWSKIFDVIGFTIYCDSSK